MLRRIPDKDTAGLFKTGDLLLKQAVIRSQPRQENQGAAGFRLDVVGPIVDRPTGGFIQLFFYL